MVLLAHPKWSQYYSFERKEGRKKERKKERLGKDFYVGYLVGFYGISTFLGYLMPNPSLYK